MSNSIPLALSNAIRFPPSSFRGHTRSPSRSPVRKSLFLAKEIDPFLSNLSPDSTLRALQATSTIDAGSAGQDILAQSIADASQEEREIGIRAAVTAQKLKQWRQELEHWPWPSVKDRRSGAGFLLPRRPSVPSLAVLNNTHMGYLPTTSVKEYQERIEDIRDGVEALELADIKEHIYSSHGTSTLQAGPEDTPGVQTKFGKMRDFTALVTATVVQALPDMVQVNMLLDTWDVRLAILRQAPGIEKDLTLLKSRIKAANASIREEYTLTIPEPHEIEDHRSLLSDQVSSLGAKIDKLLDLLEGQEDTLPKAWIDSLEGIENDFAAWVVEAEHVIGRQRSGSKTLTKQPSIQIHSPDNETSEKSFKSQRTASYTIGSRQTSIPAVAQPSSEAGTPLAELPPREIFSFPLSKKPPESSMHTRKPSLNIIAREPGHRRDVSEISVAESALSGISDLSNAEIVDARSTQVLMSPKISVVDNPFRGSRDGSSWLQSDVANTKKVPEPPALHRASTTSIKIVAKDSVRPVTVIRSQSYDMLSTIKHSPPSTPSRALRQLTGQESPRSSAEFDRLVAGDATNLSPGRRKSSMSRHPSLMVEPLTTKTKGHQGDEDELPPVPRRSSKRLARSESSESASRSSPSDLGEPQTPVMADDLTTSIASTTSPTRQSPHHGKRLTLEDKIKDILTTIPTRIRLENQSDNKESTITRSVPSTRSSTPAPVLTLSPAKVDRGNRRAAPGDVRLFHLTKSGQSKDTVPVKLFVRSVGEHGERVMVRVGGGWADLAEYLREYSIHHGSRGLTTGQLEVASLPANSTHAGSVPSGSPFTALPEAKKEMATPETPTKRRFSLSSLSSLTGGLSRKNSRSKSLTSQELAGIDGNTPPVPSIPTSYAPHAITPRSKKESRTTNKAGRSSSVTDQTTTKTSLLDTPKLPTIVTTPISSSTNASYTPLGAAGPKSGASRRAASYNMLRQSDEAWVEGMVDKARAVSGGSTPSYTVDSKSKSSGRRVFSSHGPGQSMYGMSPSPIDPASRPGTSSSRPKSRLGFGDVGSIKRVFLRRKSEKV